MTGSSRSLVTGGWGIKEAVVWLSGEDAGSEMEKY